jgi:DNA-binding winged helix-turn-helix (wHTH) protein
MGARRQRVLGDFSEFSGFDGSNPMRVRFGEFTFDTDSRQLRQTETERHLSRKAFDLLSLLVQNRPRALSKAELHERLWPATFVSEATLTSLVAEVRSALGEKAGNERFIRTVHRFGYAFKGDATEVGARCDDRTDYARCWVIWKWGQVALKEGNHLLGRDGDVTVWLESPSVSRHHARIRIAGADITIEDLGSKNGTFLRGERLTAATPLEDGDEIRLGSVSVQFRRVGPEMETVTQSAP